MRRKLIVMSSDTHKLFL